MWFSTEEHLPIHRRLFAFVRYSLPRNVSVESVLKSGCPLHSTATLVFFRCCFGFSRVGRPCYISVTNFHEFSSSPQILSWPQYITIVPVRDAQRGRIREPAKRWEATMKSGSGRRCLEPSSLWQKFGWQTETETDMTWYDRHKDMTRRQAVSSSRRTSEDVGETQQGRPGSENASVVGKRVFFLRQDLRHVRTSECILKSSLALTPIDTFAGSVDKLGFFRK